MSDLSKAFRGNPDDLEQSQYDDEVLNHIEAYFAVIFRSVDDLVQARKTPETFQKFDIEASFNKFNTFLLHLSQGLGPARSEGVFDRNPDRRDVLCEHLMRCTYVAANNFEAEAVEVFCGALKGIYAGVKTPLGTPINPDIFEADMVAKFREQEGQRYEI